MRYKIGDMQEYPPHWKALRTGLCHDWLTGIRGGERVLEILADGFPEARIYTLICKEENLGTRLPRHPVSTSFLQRVPGIFNNYRYFLPFFPLAIRGLKHADEELIISSSHCVAKSFRARTGTKHLCYCFTPMRYAWLFQEDYFGWKRKLYAPILAALRRWDRRTANRVDRFVAISEHVRKRIKKFYGREADVVYPPADTDYYTPIETPRCESDLLVSALVPYKKVDLAVKAYTQSGEPLQIIGSGTEFAALKEIAGPNITFSGRLPDEEVREAYRHCRYLIFPGEEDFGIVPVEAMACGRPVVAYGKGGATETVIDGETGIYFSEQTADSLRAAVNKAAATDWDSQRIRQRAEEFSIPNFVRDIDQILRELMCMD